MSDHDDDNLAREGAGGGVVVVIVLVLAIIVSGAWVTAYAIAGDDVPSGTTVAGVDVGGRGQDDAAAALEEGLGELAGQPITVQIEGAARGTRAPQIEPAAAGLSVDYRASVARAAGERTWNPERLWDHFTRGERLDPVVVVDSEKLDLAVAGIVDSVSKAPRDGAVKFRGGRVVVRAPRDGAGIDVGVARDAVLAAYLTDDPAVVSLVARRPEIDERDVRRALNSFANPALSGPVTLEIGNLEVRLTPRDYDDALAMEPRNGKLVPVIDSSLVNGLVDRASDQTRAPVDAVFRVTDGVPEIVPAQPGSYYGADQISAALVRALGRDQSRTATVRPSMRPAAVGDRDLRKLKIEQPLGSAKIPLDSSTSSSDVDDLTRLARLVDGTVLLPDTNFSLDASIQGDPANPDAAPTTQVATTVFAAAFRSGLMDVEHHPQSSYAPTLPVGLDATVADGRDLRFRNDTGHGVLLVVSVVPPSRRSDGSLQVRLFGTPRWDVQVQTSKPTGVVAPDLEVRGARNCVPDPGVPGFSIEVKRIFRKAGEKQVDHRTKNTVGYAAVPGVDCQRRR